MHARTGFTTEIAGNDAATCPAWNALWFRMSPTIEHTASAYGCQCVKSLGDAVVEEVDGRTS